MKSISKLAVALITTVTISSWAIAAGPGGSRGGMATGPGANTSVSAGVATQSRIHTPGTGLTTGTATQARIHTPGTGNTTGAPYGGQVNGANPGARNGAGNGIHTPGTGQIGPATVTPAGN